MPTGKIPGVNVSVKSRAAESADILTFEANVEMLDYMTLRPLKLNLIVHLNYSKGEDKTFLFHEISPAPFNTGVWEKLDYLWQTFDSRNK